MGIFFKKVLLWIQIGIGKIVDSIFELFRVFAGLGEVRVGGNETNLVEYFFTDKTVTKVLMYMLIIGFACSAIFTVFAVIKNMVTVKKPVGKILGQFFVSFTSVLIVAMILIALVFGANLVLLEIDTAFEQSMAQEGEEYQYKTVSQYIFEASVGDNWEHVVRW